MHADLRKSHVCDKKNRRSLESLVCSACKECAFCDPKYGACWPPRIPSMTTMTKKRGPHWVVQPCCRRFNSAGPHPNHHNQNERTRSLTLSLTRNLTLTLREEKSRGEEGRREERREEKNMTREEKYRIEKRREEKRMEEMQG